MDVNFLIPIDSSALNIFGLVMNTAAAVVLMCPAVRIKHSIDEDLIVETSENGLYTQKKHLADRRLNIFSASLLLAGFTLQLIAAI